MGRKGDICSGCSKFSNIKKRYCDDCERYAAHVRKKEAERLKEYYEVFPSQEMHEQYLMLKKWGFF